MRWCYSGEETNCLKPMSELKDKVKSLKLKYKNYPQKELLIPMPNPNPDREYEVEINYDEFTCLCPLNPGQPDYASINIKYVPDREILEFKSLKFYLTSYRTVEIFYEAATNQILDDLVNILKPKKLEIITDWNIRGGTKVRVKANYTKE